MYTIKAFLSENDRKNNNLITLQPNVDFISAKFLSKRYIDNKNAIYTQVLDANNVIVLEQIQVAL